ncbi:MAG: cytochrome c biogenesis protein ResB [Thermoanaerobaculia bacterium]
MVLAALYYGFLAIWATSSPPHVVQNIAGLIPFWLLYTLLLVNTAVCLWRRIPTLKKQLSPKPTLTDKQPDWEIPAPPGLDADQASALLRRLGCRPADIEGNAVAGVRCRWAGLGTYLFHGAFFLVAAGFLLTLAARQEAKVWVAVGEELTGDPGQLLSQSPPKLLAAGVPVTGFRVEDIRPEFWRDQLLFTTLEADLELASGSSATTRINRPLWLGWATFLRLSGFGYAPRYELRDANGHVLSSSFVKLNLFPPGQRDYFSPPDYPHRIYLEVFPDHGEEDGRPVSRSLNLVNPAVAVDVYRGRLALGGALLPLGDGYTFEGLTLSIPEIRYWGEFSVVWDPGAGILFLGFVVGLLGLLLKIRGGRAEAEWVADPAGEGGVLRGWGGAQPSGLPVAGENR